MNLPCFIAFVDSTTNKTFTENNLEKSLKIKNGYIVTFFKKDYKSSKCILLITES